MLSVTPIRISGLLALAVLGLAVTAGSGHADDEPCIGCLSVRVGPPIVVRGPFPDELDAPFTALKLADGSFRGFSANGITYAIDGPTLWDMSGARRSVLHASEPGGPADCGRWLTSTARSGDNVLGLVHQESDCAYNQGRTHKSMAIATSVDDGLTWTTPKTVITGRDTPQQGRITGEGDCTMIDGRDDYFYAYCLRNSDWQTIVARAPVDDPENWHKYFEGTWREPGLGGDATAIGYFGPGAAYFPAQGVVATVTPDPWFGGLRLSLSTDKVSFVDLKDPLVAIDGVEWKRPADTGLFAYATLLNPDTGSNAITQDFLLSYIYVPPNKGFESRYLVLQEVKLSMENEPQSVQAGLALTRWFDPERETYIVSTGPMTDDRRAFSPDAIVAYMLTRAPETFASVKYAECSSDQNGHADSFLAEDGRCVADGCTRERTAGWLFAAEQPGSVPVYLCQNEATQTHFASSAPDCEGLGDVEFLLGYGLAP